MISQASPVIFAAFQLFQRVLAFPTSIISTSNLISASVTGLTVWQGSDSKKNKLFKKIDNKYRP